MLNPLDLSMPARPEWGLVARSVVLSYASTMGMESSRLDELSLLMGQLWDEMTCAPGITRVAIQAREGDRAVRLEVNGTGDGEYAADILGDRQPEEWSSLLASRVVGHLAADVTYTRTPDHLRIEAAFPLQAIS